MNKIFFYVAVVLFSAASSAKESEFDAKKFANEYFQAFVATQSPVGRT